MTCGPYRPITLRTYPTRIQDVYPKIYTEPFIALKVDVELSGKPQRDVCALVFTLKTLAGETIESERWAYGNLEQGKHVKLDNVIFWDQLQDKGVELWWPFNYGRQSLYDLEVSALGKDDEVIDIFTRRIGFRSVALIEERLSEPDQYGLGTSFVFEVNRVKMFVGGSNWIPADNFFTRITNEKYRHLLELAREGNQNMVRIWGGGIYEPDIFFDLCDELGILVWQDFQFACGVYPAHEEFIENVTVEAEQNVKRLRHHPSLALLCGNNEDYQQILQWKERPELPARKLYEEVFPQTVAKLTDPPIPYHRGSPYGGKGWDTTDQTVGDVHVWDIWGGKELPYQQYDKLGGRFVSEFGIPSFPSMHTIRHWMGDAEKGQWYAQSPLIAQHVRAGSFDRRFAIVMNENFRVAEDLETHAFRTQVMQAEGVGFAYRSWKQGWAGERKEYTGGVLVWQLNDCWPVVSWAIIDYFMRPKPAYYTIARVLKPLSLHITRKVAKNRNHDRPEQFYEFGAFQSTGATLIICAASTSLSETQALVSLRYYDLRSTSAAVAWQGEPKDTLETLPANKAVDLYNFKCPEPPADESTINNTSATVVACARLLHPETGEVLARYVDWPEPYKYVQFPDPGLLVSLERHADGSAVLGVEVDRPVKGLFFSVQEPDERDWEVIWSDNNLDVVPEDPQFACGVYPAHEEFIENVTVEAEQNVKRLRHHPSLALLCGNNEDYQQILQWKERPELPARKLYEEVFPQTVAKLTDPPIPYHRGSPYGGKGWDTTDQTVGDVHVWDIWGGKELPYQQYDKLGGRFVSEFGIPSFPSTHTIRHWMGDAEKGQWYAQSPLIAQHVRAGSFDRRFAIVMNENFRVAEDLETHAFRTQVMQAEGVGFAYRSWKQGWAGERKEYTGGVLVWQLNDCWPVVSWAIIDYFMRPKPAYYTIARVLKPLSLHITRKVAKNRNHDRPEQFYEFGAFQSTRATLIICTASTSLSQTQALVSLRYYDLRSTSAAVAWRGEPKDTLETLPANKAVDLYNFKCPEPPADESTINNTSATVVACARLLHPETGEVLARYVDWPEPYKYVQFPDPGLLVSLERHADGSAVLGVEVDRPVKGLFFSVQESDERDWEVIWSDNNLDVVPEDPQVIVIKKLRDRKVQYAYLGGETAKALIEN
ncbi:putative beta-mannosidase B [Leucoagaricus sp. SymC.cos]|nr:putative beta-mannosidase B [Leucoagaricus sp. SymC.cos]